MLDALLRIKLRRAGKMLDALLRIKLRSISYCVYRIAYIVLRISYCVYRIAYIVLRTGIRANGKQLKISD